MKKNLLAILISGMLSAPAMAFDPFTVKDIRIEGIQRTEAGTVFSYLPVKVGDTVNDDRVAQAIKALFATGFFKDVRIELERDVLVVIVEERPAVAQISFSGMKEFEKDKILTALKDTGVAEGRIFDRSSLERSEQELKRQYLARGLYSAVVTTTVTPLERNRVGVSFNIDEGSPARIKKINVVGAAAFSEKQLQGLFELSTANWLSWYTKNDQYSRQKLLADVEKLRSFYLDRGYLEFAVDSTQVSISPDKKDVYVTISVNEGDRYQVSSVKLAGDLAINEGELRKLVELKPGDVFSRQKLNDSTKNITDRLSKEGYAFANVNAAPDIDKEKRQVAFTVFVDPGKRVYVRRVNVLGNTKTRDEVIRREMRQMEGGWYDSQKVELSKQRIDKTALFKEVTLETPPVPGTADQVDVNVTVEEKPSGNLMFGAGFSSSEKLVLSGSISQNNIFGSGKNVAVQVSTGDINKIYSLSYTNPYFTVDGVSQGFDIYYKDTNTNSLSIGYYKSESYGGGIRIGYPLGEKEFLSFTLALDSTEINIDRLKSPPRYQNFVANNPGANFSAPISATWISDGKDSHIFPTKGSVLRASVEVSPQGTDLSYYRAGLSAQRFIPLNQTFVLAVGGEVGYAGGISGKELPFYKNYFAGGIGSVRGYRAASLGPTETYRNAVDNEIRTDRLGGRRMARASAELMFGLPGFDRSLRMGLFADVGQVFGDSRVYIANYQPEATCEWCASVGLSLAWISPFGPLKFSIAQPINKESGDKTERFQFQMGTTY